MMNNVTSRFAGKALYDALKAIGAVASTGVEKAVLGKLSNVEDATGLIGLMAKHPETTAKLAGAATLPAVAGIATGTGALISSLQQNNYSLPVQSQSQVTRMPSYAAQPYGGGYSPLTNEQAGELILDQQRFYHNMELINARQRASAPQGMIGFNPALSQNISGQNISNAINRTYTYG